MNWRGISTAEKLRSACVIFADRVARGHEEHAFDYDEADIEPTERPQAAVLDPIAHVRDHECDEFIAVELKMFVMNLNQQIECLDVPAEF